MTRIAARTGMPAALAVTMIAGGMLLAGCTAGMKHGQPDADISAAATRAAASQAAATKAISLIKDAYARSQSLQGYEIIFHRRERRGLLDRLSDWENIKVFYRKQPTSIKMTWLDPQSEYKDCVYVAGVNDDKVTVMPRKGLFGMAPAALSVAPEMAVTFGKSLRPITEFGLAFMVRRTLERIEEAKRDGGAKVTYAGITRLEKTGIKAHHIVVIYPAGFGQSGKQDLYIDAQTGYPAGSYLWRDNGQLLAAYLYEKPKTEMPAESLFAIN